MARNGFSLCALSESGPPEGMLMASRPDMEYGRRSEQGLMISQGGHAVSSRKEQATVWQEKLRTTTQNFSVTSIPMKA